MNNIGVKLAVRLVKGSNTIGSGFYIPLPKHDYDLIGTAKHCLCNKDPEKCSVNNPDICNNCSDIEFQTLEYKNEDKTNTIVPLDENPIYLSDRDVAFVKVSKNDQFIKRQIVQSGEVDERLYACGFPSGSDNGKLDIRCDIPLLNESNSKFSLSFNTIGNANCDSQDENFKGLSGGGLYTEKGKLVGIYTDTSTTGAANGDAVKFDNYILSFLAENSIDLSIADFISFDKYQERAFEGFEDIAETCKNNSQNIIEKLTPQNIIDSNGLDLYYPKKFKTLQDLINFITEEKTRNNKLWEGWLQLLTYLEIINVDIEDISKLNVKIEVESTKFFGLKNSKQKKTLLVSLLFTDQEYYDIAKAYVKDKLKGNIVSDSCNIFHSIKNNFGIKPFPTKDHIKLNIAGDDTIQIPQYVFGITSIPQLTDAVIKSDDLNQVRIKLTQCFQDAIK